MKTIDSVVLAVVLFLLAGFLAAFQDSPSLESSESPKPYKPRPSVGRQFETTTIKGHIYFVSEPTQSSGTRFPVHAHHCPCLEKPANP